MWTRRVIAALLAVPVLLMGALPIAQAAPNPKLTVTAVSFGKPSVAVSGLNLAPMTLTVKGGYDSTDRWTRTSPCTSSCSARVVPGR